MELKLGDVQTTALIPLAVKANETLRPNARIKDRKAVEIIQALKIDTAQYDKFMSHEGVIARTIMLDRQLKGIIRKAPDTQRGGRCAAVRRRARHSPPVETKARRARAADEVLRGRSGRVRLEPADTRGARPLPALLRGGPDLSPWLDPSSSV